MHALRLPRLVLLVSALSTLASTAATAAPPAASAVPNGCIDDLTGRTNNCTANDVAITEIRVLQVLDPCTGPGDTAVVLLRLRLEASAAERYDVGLFIAQDGGDARTGDCVHDGLPPPLAGLCCYDPTSGTGPFLDAEDTPGSGDECGDIEQGVQTFYILQSPIQVQCVDQDSNGSVDIGTCTSWDNQQGTVCLNVGETLPSTPAKCRCERLNVNLPIVENQPPACSAGGPYAGGCRTAVIDGATVTDPDEDALTYVWQSDNPDVTVIPSSGNIPAGPGTRSVPPATAVLADAADPCNVTALLTLVVTDSSNNQTTCQATVTLDDQTPPVISAPPDVTVSCDAVPPPVDPVATDSCDPDPVVTLVETRSNGTCPDSYTLTRTWTVTDACGNTASDTQTVTVVDTTAPVIGGVPGNATVECDAVPPPAQVTVTDNCDPSPALSFVETRTNGSCPDSYTLTRTWTATDRCGNSASASQTITVIDSTAPVLSGVPGDVTVQCDAVPPPAQVTVTDNCDPAPSLTFLETRTDGSCPDDYTLTRTWTAADRCGNAVSISQTITVVDDTAPVIAGAPADETVECDAVPPAAQVTVTDNCDPSPTVTFDETRTDGSCADSYLLARTWTATDRCSNTATAAQTVTVVDTTAPVVQDCGFEPVAPAPPQPPSPPRSPASPAPPSSPGSGASCRSQGTFRVRCGAATDNCDPSPAVMAEIVVRRNEVVDGACVPTEETIPIACDAVVELRLLAPPCPARPPRTPRGPRSPSSAPGGATVIEGEHILLRVRAADRCGNAAAACEAEPPLCAPASRPCPVPVCPIVP